MDCIGWKDIGGLRVVAYVGRHGRTQRLPPCVISTSRELKKKRAKICAMRSSEGSGEVLERNPHWRPTFLGDKNAGNTTCVMGWAGVFQSSAGG